MCVCEGEYISLIFMSGALSAEECFCTLTLSVHLVTADHSALIEKKAAELLSDVVRLFVTRRVYQVIPC